MTDRDGYYLDRPSQAALIELLDQIPGLVDDIAVTFARQEQFGSGVRVTKGSDEQPLIANLHAGEIIRELHQELSGWVHLVAEQRHIDIWPVGYTHPHNFIGPLQLGERRMRIPINDWQPSIIELARWLKRWIIALALTEGAEDALPSIQKAVRQARRAADRPAEQLRPEPDQKEMAEADRMVLNASAAARLAKSVGYQDLTVRRIKYLRESGRITPVHTAGRTVVFLFGDIRRAHKQLIDDEQPVAS